MKYKQILINPNESRKGETKEQKRDEANRIQKHNDLNSTGHSKISSQREVYSDTSLPQERGKKLN